MSDLNEHSPECIRRMYQDAGVTVRYQYCECGDTDCLVQDRHNVPASALRDEDCGEPAAAYLVSAENGMRAAFCPGCINNALQSGAWATSQETADALRTNAGEDLEGDLENDLGDGGLGSGHWLKRDE